MLIRAIRDLIDRLPAGVGWTALAASAVLLGLRLHWLYFITLPTWLARAASPAMRDRRRKYHEMIAATPAVGRFWKLTALLNVLQSHVEQGRHREVVATARRLLATTTTPAIVAGARRHLADSLEALGDPSAAEERERARAVAEAGGGDAAIPKARGVILDRELRFAEAYEVYREGLDAAPGPPAVRVELLLHMALSAFNAGRSEDSADCAERAVAEGATGSALRLAHRQAGNALKTIGRLGAAEAHKRRAHELAVAGGDRAEIAEAGADLAEILRVRGRVSEAIAACDAIIAADASRARQAWVVRYEALRVQGRYAEAAEAIAHARRSSPLAIPHYEARSRAVLAIGDAHLALLGGRADEAEGWVDQARPAFGADPKLSFLVDVVDAWIAAARGDGAAFAEIAGGIEGRLPEIAESPSSTRGALATLGRAATAIGDLEYAAECWSRYLDLDPLPVDRPAGLYHLADCLDRLGRPGEARPLFREAAGSGVDVLASRLARERS